MDIESHQLKSIKGSNLSIVWARAFQEAMSAGPTPPLFASISSLGEEDLEITGIRNVLDDYLNSCNESSVHTVANTIFPINMWNRSRERDQLYKRYREAWPRISQCPANRNGTYFNRLINYNGQGTSNQLEHIINTWNGVGMKSPTRRHTALQAAIFDPNKDHSRSPQRGFPCLQQVSFTPLGPKGQSGLAVTGFYPTQLIFEKAYGNYLGLYRLGIFMSHEMNIDLVQVNCISIRSTYSHKKSKNNLNGLLDKCMNIT